MNIILDWLAKRIPFHSAAEDLLKRGEIGEIEILISTMSFISTEYILRKQLGKDKTKTVLSAVKNISTVCSSGEKVISLSLLSDFNDFEDAFQYYSALENSAQYIITRDFKGYSSSKIPVMNAEEFIKTQLP